MMWRLRVFSSTKLVTQHIPVLILLLTCAPYHIVGTCQPVKTPWTTMCRTECVEGNHEVLMSDCNATTLEKGSDPPVRWRFDGLQFENSGITSVSKPAFSALSGYSFEWLTLQDSFVNFVPGAFEGMDVTYLSIERNKKLMSLPSGLFRGITRLEELNLMHNALLSLPSDIFQPQGLTGMTYLNLNNNSIRSLPSDIFQELTDLEHLDISFNEISCFPLGLLETLQSLNYLRMKQRVELYGLCAQSFRGVGVKSGEVLKLGFDVSLDECVLECGPPKSGVETKPSNTSCNCESKKGCLTCSETPTKQPGGAAGMNSATWRMAFIFHPVMVKICLFDF